MNFLCAQTVTRQTAITDFLHGKSNKHKASKKSFKKITKQNISRGETNTHFVRIE